MSNKSAGVLYVVATPIGNREDLSPRARRILEEVKLIAVEDTRHSGQLLSAAGVRTPMLSVHDHNEAQRVPALIERLALGDSVALISDAGTPLVSDPGYHLVSACHDAGIRVAPVPGPSALMAALSVAGLATDSFSFFGFLPRQVVRRKKLLESLARQPGTLIFFETPHRLRESLDDMVGAFGADRLGVVARELTKLHETVLRAPLGELAGESGEGFGGPGGAVKGEIVVLVDGYARAESARVSAEGLRVLGILRRVLPLKTAAALAAEISGDRKNLLYRHGLELEPED
ncbi:MAG: 16S rRNA (cytidine(1402)-2'-O)-methyltransferase [Pseudomonadota bacterium]